MLIAEVDRNYVKLISCTHSLSFNSDNFVESCAETWICATRSESLQSCESRAWEADSSKTRSIELQKKVLNGLS